MTATETLAPQSDNTAEKPQLRVSTASYIPTLDGWRAIAITLVLLAHGSHSMAAVLGPSFTFIQHSLESGGLPAVRIFFGISGFLITSRLIAELDTQREGSMKRFYIRRAFRILPPAMSYLIVIGALMLTGLLIADAKGWLAAMFFGVNYVGARWYVGHFWSLAVEEHFYLLWPALLAFVGTRRGLWTASIGAILFVLWRGFRFYMQWYSDGTVWGQTDFQLDGLLWGAACACLCTYPVAQDFLSRALAGFRGYLIIALFVASFAVPYINWKVHHMVYAVQSVMIPLLLLVTVMHPRTWLGRLMENPIPRWVGHISYSLYLWQQLFLPDTAARAPKLALLQTFPLNLIFVFACASASYYLVEQPMIGIGRKLCRHAEDHKPRRVELGNTQGVTSPR